jgi:hypothetical protein
MHKWHHFYKKQNIMESNQNSIVNIKSFLDKVTLLEKTLTQLPRGSWVINVAAGHNRILFVNLEKVNLKYDVQFTKVLTSLTKFLTRERLAFDKLEGSLKPLRDLIESSPVSNNQLRNQCDQALSALKVYNLHMSTHANQVSNIKTALAESIITTKADLKLYLEDKPAGQDEAMNFYNGFESQIKNTVKELDTILTTTIPNLYKQGITLLK